MTFQRGKFFIAAKRNYSIHFHHSFQGTNPSIVNSVYFFQISHAELPKARQRSSMAVRKLSSPDTSTYHYSNVLGNNKLSNNSNVITNTFSAVIVKSSSQLPNSKLDSDTKIEWLGDTQQQSNKHEYTLGRLDGLVSSPNRCSKVRVADSRKIAAILLETNIVELQRHLLTITVQNQVSTNQNTTENMGKLVTNKTTRSN